MKKFVGLNVLKSRSSIFKLQFLYFYTLLLIYNFSNVYMKTLEKKVFNLLS